MANKLLLVTYLFPPFGGVGVHRALSLAKYLPEHGFAVHVLTTRNPSVVGMDDSLRVPSCVTVHRTLTLDLPFRLKKFVKRRVAGKRVVTTQESSDIRPGRLRRLVKDMFCPDPQILWLPTALRAADKIVRTHNIDTVLVSVPTYSSLRIGTVLKKRYPHLRLVSDFRDEWLTYYFHTLAFNPTERNWRTSVALERETVEASDLVVAVTDAARDEIRKRYSGQCDNKFAVIANGFDPATFAGFRSRPNASGKMLVTYTGTVYKPTDPTTLVAALDKLEPSVRDRCRFQFIGKVEEPAFRQMLASQPTVELTGFVPQKQAVAQLEMSDFALLIWTDTLNIPGKLYDYMGSGKPTLVLAHPESDVWRRVIETGMGWCADVRDPDAIAALLRRALSEPESLKKELQRNEDAVNKYTRTALAREYAALLKGLAGRKLSAAAE